MDIGLPDTLLLEEAELNVSWSSDVLEKE